MSASPSLGYWFFVLLRVRQGSLLRKCVTCCKVIGKSYSTPEPQPLPSVRTRQARPFEVAGVDFTGALHIKTLNICSNMHVCLFTCSHSLWRKDPQCYGWQLNKAPWPTPQEAPINYSNSPLYTHKIHLHTGDKSNPPRNCQ